MFTSSILTLARPASRCDAHVVPARCHHLPRACQRRERRQLALAGAPVTFHALTAEGPTTTDDFAAPSGILGGLERSREEELVPPSLRLGELPCVYKGVMVSAEGRLTPVPPHANASPRLHIVFLEGLI